MRREPAGDEVERRVLERQPLGAASSGRDVREPLLFRRGRHRRQHLAGQVQRGDGLGVFRHQIGHVSAAGAEIDRVDRSGPLDDPGERGEVLALRVDRALDVSLGSRTELIRDEFFMSFRHVLASDIDAKITTARLLQAEHLSYYIR